MRISKARRQQKSLRRPKLLWNAGFTPEKQEAAARGIVAGVNTRNPGNVDLLRNHSGGFDCAADNARIDETSLLKRVGVHHCGGL